MTPIGIVAGERSQSLGKLNGIRIDFSSNVIAEFANVKHAWEIVLQV